MKTFRTYAALPDGFGVAVEEITVPAEEPEPPGNGAKAQTDAGGRAENAEREEDDPTRGQLREEMREAAGAVLRAAVRENGGEPVRPETFLFHLREDRLWNRYRRPKRTAAAAQAAAERDLILVTTAAAAEDARRLYGTAVGGNHLRETALAVAMATAPCCEPDDGLLADETMELLRIAAAGNHPVLFTAERGQPADGPGSAVPMFAGLAGRTACDLLAPLGREQCHERLLTWDAAGLCLPHGRENPRPVFRMPYHGRGARRMGFSTTAAGAKVPGELMLAGHGVLVFDDVDAFGIDEIALAVGRDDQSAAGMPEPVHPLVIGYRRADTRPLRKPADEEARNRLFELRGPAAAGPGKGKSPRPAGAMKRQVRAARARQEEQTRHRGRIRYNAQMRREQAAAFSGERRQTPEAAAIGRLAKTLCHLEGETFVSERHCIEAKRMLAAQRTAAPA